MIKNHDWYNDKTTFHSKRMCKMTRKLRILITNDDGIHAPGIKHLWQAIHEEADVTIIAPAAEQSAVGLSITVRNPLQIHRVDWPKEANAWCVTGTPADCVKMALSVVMESPPDLIVSGINRGSNAGRNLLYSGTVGGVIEGILQGIPGIAFSHRAYQAPNFHTVEQYIPKVIDYITNHPLPKGTLLNVTFPEDTDNGVKGFKMTRQGKELWGEAPDERYHPAEGHTYYWMGAKLQHFEEDEDSDITWLKRGYMTAVPVHVDELTDSQHLDEKRHHFEGHLNKHFSKEDQ
jgi:5'/3'-nucleotidase